MKALSTATSVCSGVFPFRSTTCMSPSRTSFLRALCSLSCYAEEMSWACSSSFSTSCFLMFYTPVLRPWPGSGLFTWYTVCPQPFLQQGLVQKNQWVCAWRDILVPVSVHVYVYPQNPPSSSLYLTSLTKWETIHIVFGLLFVVALLILNLTFFIFCSSLFQDCFKLLSMSLPFFSFTLHYSSVLPVS